MTLPLIYALNHTDKKTKNKIINYIKNDSENENKVREVIAFVKQTGGMEYAEKAMIKYQDEALEILKHFPQSEARDSLDKLVYFFTNRKN